MDLGHTTIVAGCQLQKQIIDALKAAGFTSQIQGSTEARIWFTPHRTPEEWNRIEAVVSVKEFMAAQATKHGLAGTEVEMVWRGKVVLGRHQALYNASQREPAENDTMLEDSCGDHTGWFILASKVAEGLRPSGVGGIPGRGPH